MDALESRWKNLSLIEEKLAPIRVKEDFSEEDNIKSRRSPLRKLSSNSSIGKEVLQSTMNKIRKISNKVIFKEMNQNLFNHLHYGGRQS